MSIFFVVVLSYPFVVSNKMYRKVLFGWWAPPRCLEGWRFCLTMSGGQYVPVVQTASPGGRLMWPAGN